MTAWQRLVFDGGGLAAIAVPLLVLLAFAAAFVLVAARALHRGLTRG